MLVCALAPGGLVLRLSPLPCGTHARHSIATRALSFIHSDWSLWNIQAAAPAPVLSGSLTLPNQPHIAAAWDLPSLTPPCLLPTLAQPPPYTAQSLHLALLHMPSYVRNTHCYFCVRACVCTGTSIHSINVCIHVPEKAKGLPWVPFLGQYPLKNSLKVCCVCVCVFAYMYAHHIHAGAL